MITTDDLKKMNLSEIADVIARDWKGRVNYAAKPYLQAMFELDSVQSNYGADSGAYVVRYFLGNATTWRGPVAREVKAELNRRVKGVY
jgi:hypothetical protein